MALNIKLLHGLSTALPATKVDGRLLFCTDTKEIYFEINGDRIKLYDSLDTAKADIISLKNLVGSTAVATQISDAIADLKKLVVAEADAGNNGVDVKVVDNADSSAKKITVSAKISGKTGNTLTIETGTGEEGLYVPAPAAADTYTVKKAATADTGFAATYQLYKVAPDTTETAVGDKINIAKDFLVKSADIKEVATADDPYTGAVVGDKYIDFVINTKDGTDTAEHLYLPVNELVDVYTSGSTTGDMVVVAVDASTNKITATITDGTVTKAKLETTVQTSLGLADTAVQPSELAVVKTANKYLAGIDVAADGTITMQTETLPDISALQWGAFTDVSST